MSSFVLLLLCCLVFTSATQYAVRLERAVTALSTLKSSFPAGLSKDDLWGVSHQVVRVVAGDSSEEVETSTRRLYRHLRDDARLPVRFSVSDIQAALTHLPFPIVADPVHFHLPCLGDDGADLPAELQARPGSCNLKRLRHRLLQNRHTHALFDTPLWVDHFQHSVEMLWDLYELEQPLMHIVVPM
eukprot:GILJ01007052.1.p1 GENE.GILJ01007052.1~~GILJ01007052.1.p1  ORF type:complete len:198 (+),score=14.36 GILJ01007052.1:38-595(+)